MALIALPTICLDFEIDRARVSWDAFSRIPKPIDAEENTFVVWADDLHLVEADFVNNFSQTALAGDKKIVVSGSQLFSISDVRWEFGGRNHEYKQLKLAIEAKSSIPAVGELIRQMKFYRGHVGGAKLFVVAPAEAWPTDAQTILREQGIEPINYQSNFA